jgi:hypothetical protein
VTSVAPARIAETRRPLRRILVVAALTAGPLGALAGHRWISRALDEQEAVAPA